MRFPPKVSAILGGALVASALALPATVIAAPGISLTRTPAPPQSVGAGEALNLDFEVSFNTVPFSLRFEVKNPSGQTVHTENIPVSSNSVTDARSYRPPAGSPFGRYVARYVFSEQQGFEAEAAVVFDFAEPHGSLVEEVFHDRNGNGVRESGEEGISGWPISLTNPQGNRVVIQTDADGRRSDARVPVGLWQVATREDPAASGWRATTATSANVAVPENGTGRFSMGLVRPGQVCGTVFLDTDRDGIKAATERGAGDIKLELTGTTGTGAPVPATTLQSAGNGEYCFTNLLPGNYSVKIFKPGGYTLTTVQIRSGRSVESGGRNDGNDFGLASPLAPSIKEPPASLTIDKSGPAQVRRNSTFPFTVIVKNTGKGRATDVILTDPVPDTMILAGKPAGATLENGVISWKLGTILPGKSKRVRMLVRVRPGVQVKTARNVASVSANGIPPRNDAHSVRLTDPPPPPRTGGVTG